VRVAGRFSPLAVCCVLVIAVVACVGYLLAAGSVQAQNRALLRQETTQAAEFVSSLASNLGSGLDVLAPEVTNQQISDLAFDVHGEQLASGGTTFVLARKDGAQFHASAVVGPGFSLGQPIDGQLAATLDRAGATITPGPVRYNGHVTTFGLAVGPPLVPSGTAIYEQLQIDPYIAVTAEEAAPFRVLRAAVYASRDPTRSELLLANSRELPAAASLTVPVTVGNATWWLYASAVSPLAGSFSTVAPFVVLGTGLVIALAMGTIIEIVVRRKRYADNLVTDRTVALMAAQAALVRHERLSAMGQMTTVVGHELRNPLGIVLNALYMARSSLADPSQAESHISMAEQGTKRAIALAQDLIDYMRERPPQLAPVDLATVVADVVRTMPPPAEVSLTLDAEPVVVDADDAQLTQVFTNLIQNAYQAMPHGGSLHVAVRSGADSASVVIADSGIGFEESNEDRLFEPFFTTRPAGTGLGLAIVRRLVEGHGGHVSIHNGASGGAVVTVEMPINTYTPEHTVAIANGATALDYQAVPCN